MALNEATYEKLYREQSRRLAFIEQTLKILTINGGVSRWITEEEAMIMTGLKKRSLLDKRKAGVFHFSTATGRKIKYLRKDVEAYLNNNSTIIPKKQTA